MPITRFFEQHCILAKFTYHFSEAVEQNDNSVLG
jgi:hypothetical protein